MPKYYYWCSLCKHGYSVRTPYEEGVFPYDLGPVVTCTPDKKRSDYHPPDKMERLGRWPQGLQKLKKRRRS